MDELILNASYMALFINNIEMCILVFPWHILSLNFTT